MSDPAELPSSLGAWLDGAYPGHQHRTLGISGAGLFYHALLQQQRSTVILPAFTSYTLSGAATLAGKRVLHVDADPDTLHMRSDLLDDCIRTTGADDAVVLVDHTCGYPFPSLAELRRRHPAALIVEDCVRALGGEAHGEQLGSQGDWTLLSLYKTTPGNLDGALLLSRSTLDSLPEQTDRLSFKQLLSLLPAARSLHERLRARSFAEPDRERGSLAWRPRQGAPTNLCARRFTTWVDGLTARCARQREVAARLREAIAELPGLRVVETAPGCISAAHFLAFLISAADQRNRLLSDLHRRGSYLERTWHVVPAFYRGFAATFPHGSAGSEFLADHIAHIPIADVISTARQDRLIERLRSFCKDRG